MKVLIIDDEDLICENLKSKIKRLNHSIQYEIYTTNSAHEGELIFKQQQTQFVITDINMPGMSGLNLIERIRKLDKYVVILALSGYDDYNYIRKAFLLGVDDYLLKPISITELDQKFSQYHSRFIKTKTINNNLVELQQDNSNKIMKYALEYIELNINKNITMKDVVNHVCVSYHYFSKLFKDYTNNSFPNYILKLRMDKAIEYMKDPYLRVNEISEKVGYLDPNHFSRAFKKYTGKYPTDYRKEMEDKI